MRVLVSVRGAQVNVSLLVDQSGKAVFNPSGKRRLGQHSDRSSGKFRVGRRNLLRGAVVPRDFLLCRYLRRAQAARLRLDLRNRAEYGQISQDKITR